MYGIENWFLLNNLSETDKTEVIKTFDEPKAFKKGESIYTVDSFEKAIGVLLSGSATAHGENVLKNTFSKGDTFGAAAIFGNDGPYISEITAKTDCLIQFVSENSLREIFEKYPVTAINYISFLSQRVRFLNEKISLFTCKGVSMKLYRYLVDNADENNTVKIANMTSLAKQTSIGRTSLYRALEMLKSNGMIERESDTIIIK